jgi:methionyl-tRNA synthetase
MFKFLKKENKGNVVDGAQTQSQSQPELQNEAQVSKPEERTDGKISYDDFAKVEMTVGEIIAAEKVENADRLLKLKVDFGNETRQIVSGIAEYYQPQELIGRKSPFVTNLEPRKIRGEESNGMILATKDADGNFALLSVDEKIAKGTKLS